MSEQIINAPMLRGLTASQSQVLENMRRELCRAITALFPHSTDKGKTELQIVMGKAEALYGQVVPMAQRLFMETVTNQCAVQITNEGLSDFISNEFLNRFVHWSKDELLLLLVIIHTDRVISEHNLRGLPHSEEAASSIIKLPRL